ncbi:MAG: hypothetical protein V1800_01890 [Candidatus Latescibacterota bacterium]
MTRLILKGFLLMLSIGGCATFQASSEPISQELPLERPEWTAIEGSWTAQTIAVLPFEDKSHYDGAWDIKGGTAGFLGEVLRENAFYTIIPKDSVRAVLERRPDFSASIGEGKMSPSAISAIGAELNADVLISGKIEVFNISRFMAGAQMLGGYRSFSSNVRLEATLWRVMDGRELGVLGGEGEVMDRDIGLTLLGRPTENDSQFYGLTDVEFGSEVFRKTILGRAMAEALQEIKAKVEEVVTPPSALKASTRPVLVLEVQDNTVYINAGAEDGVTIGDKLNVYGKGKALEDPSTGEVLGYTDGQKVGAIQIIEIKGAHLSKARIVDGQVEAHFSVRSE